MKDITSRLKDADALLEPNAVKHSEGLGRHFPETESMTRFRFQRDRGRIVHTEAFRRLKSKTQVFVGGGGDHYRTRLTHTMEVAGISRDIARALGVNEDLAECIALAHDLGHPPFGHAGESTLNEWLGQFEKSFEHNLQSHRIVTVLETHTSLYEGLNLNIEILEGLLKHSTPHDHTDEILIDRSPSLEAQIVNLADEITYTAHDSEDGLAAKLFSIDEIASVPLAARAYEQTKERGTSLRGALIDQLVTDLYENKKIKTLLQRSNTLDEVYSSSDPLIFFSETMRAELDQLRSFLWNNMYNHTLVLEHTRAGQQVIKALCDYLHDHPTEKISEWMKIYNYSKEGAVKDYVSGMTDSYAFTQADNYGLLSSEAISVLAQEDA